MPSKFGGIPIDETPKAAHVAGSRFGGIPVDDEPQETHAAVKEKLAGYGEIPMVPGSAEEAEFDRLTKAEQELRPQQESPSIGQRIVGGIEAVGSTILGGAAGGIGELVGGVEGAVREITTGQTGTGLAERTAEKRGAQLSEPFAPATQEGQRQAGIIGETLEPLSSLPPFVPGGAAVALAAPVAGSRIADAAAKLGGKKHASKAFLEERIKAGDTDVSLLGKVYSEGEIAKNPNIGRAKKQGFDEKVLRSIETANPETKAAIRRQVEILKKRKVDADYGATNRTTDAIGDNVYKRYQALDDLRKTKGKKVRSAALKLNSDIDVGQQSLFDSLDDAGVKISKYAMDENGDKVEVDFDMPGKFEADFGDVDLANIGGTKTAVNSVLARLSKGNVDAYGAHKLKTLINDTVDFGRLPTADSKIAKGVENALKGFSSGINEKLRGMSPAYAKANDEFRGVIGPLSEMDRVFKTMLKIDDTDSLKKAIGTKAARTVMSNNTSRGAMLSTLKNADESLKKNNVNFKDDLIKQAVAADELERIFGTEANTSLHGQVGRADEKAIRSVFAGGASGGITGLAIDAAVAGARAVRGVNEKNAIKALDKLLER